MPIRQERMISLINAAIEYRALAALASSWMHDPAFQHMTRDEIIGRLTSIQSQLDYALVEHSARHDATITNEYRYFAINMNRNARAKAKMQVKRRADGIEPRQQYRNLNEFRTLVVRSDVVDPPADSIPRPTRQRRIQLTPEEEAELQAVYEENERLKQQEQREENTPFHDEHGKPRPLNLLIQDEETDEEDDKSVTDPSQLGF